MSELRLQVATTEGRADRAARTRREDGGHGDQAARTRRQDGGHGVRAARTRRQGHSRGVRARRSLERLATAETELTELRERAAKAWSGSPRPRPSLPPRGRAPRRRARRSRRFGSSLRRPAPSSTTRAAGAPSWSSSSRRPTPRGTRWPRPVERAHARVAGWRASSTASRAEGDGAEARLRDALAAAERHDAALAEARTAAEQAESKLAGARTQTEQLEKGWPPPAPQARDTAKSPAAGTAAVEWLEASWPGHSPRTRASARSYARPWPRQRATRSELAAARSEIERVTSGLTAARERRTPRWLHGSRRPETPPGRRLRPGRCAASRGRWASSSRTPARA